MSPTGTPRPHRNLIFLWLPLLVGLQSIPGTGALRTFMLLFGLAHILWWWKCTRSPIARLQGWGEVWLFVALSAWLFFQSAFVSSTPEISIQRWIEEWLKLLLMALVGINIARLCSTNWHLLTTALFAGGFLHVISVLGLQALSFAKGGGVIFGDSLLGNYGYVSPFTTAAFAWLLADIANRLWHDRRLLPWSMGVSVAFMAMTLFAEVLLRAKAAQVMAALLVFFVIAAFLFRGKVWHRSATMALPLLLAGVIVVFHGGSDRWQGAWESIRLAWDGPIDTETLTGSSDPQAKVNQVDQSFYPRMVWARAGLEGVLAHPMGLGYGADAFGRYVAEKFGIPGAVSSHSGWIDFALANGIVGLVLFLALATALVRRGWLSFLAGNPVGAALALLVVHFVGRALLDGNLAGSRLTGFSLVAGALWALCAMQKNATRPG